MPDLENVEDTYLHRKCDGCGFVMTTTDRYCYACYHTCPPPLLWHMSPEERKKFRREMEQAHAEDRKAAAKDSLGFLLGLPFLIHVGVEMIMVVIIAIGLILWLLSLLA